MRKIIKRQLPQRRRRAQLLKWRSEKQGGNFAKAKIKKAVLAATGG
jgi:hypothetical protein